MARFSNLDVPTICTTDPAQITTQTIQEWEADFLTVQHIAKTLAPGDPVRLILLRMAAREVQLRSLINYTYQQNFIIAAVGLNLDAIGSNYGVGGVSPGTGLSGGRLPASYAVTTLRFTLQSTVNTDVPIPLNTQVAISGGTSPIILAFSTDVATMIPQGQTTVDVAATAMTTGSLGNGYTAGQITQIVNYQLPFVISASNTTTTQGGAEEESDDAYAFRLSLIPGAFSVAGPIGAYQYWGFSVSPSVIDVSIVTPDTTPSVAAGCVDVYTLLTDGAIPDSSFLALVQSFFSRDIRPQGDLVTARAPTITTYNVSLTYYVDPINQPLLTQIQANIAQAVAQFNTWVRTKIGRNINPSYLVQLVKEAGASDVVITLPARTILDSAHVGNQSGTMTLTFGGFDI